VLLDFAWIAFIRVSTSVSKVTSLDPSTGVVGAMSLLLFTTRVGEFIGVFQRDSDLIGGLWL
jgi:hypothetical protein